MSDNLVNTCIILITFLLIYIAILILKNENKQMKAEIQSLQNIQYCLVNVIRESQETPNIESLKVINFYDKGSQCWRDMAIREEK